jgi:hypothetical protein
MAIKRSTNGHQKSGVLLRKLWSFGRYRSSSKPLQPVVTRKTRVAGAICCLPKTSLIAAQKQWKKAKKQS